MRLSRSARIDTARNSTMRVCVAAILIAAFLVAPISNHAATLKHQATGTIQSHGPSTIVLTKSIGKHKAEWDFVLTHETQVPPGANKGVRVTIYYHDDNGKRVADRIKVVSVPGAK